jgi:hypothetical protein
VLIGEALGFPLREKPPVHPAVVAHGQTLETQVDDLNSVRMAALLVERMIMVASVRRRRSTRCYLGYSRSISYLIHDSPHIIGCQFFTSDITLPRA